MRGRLDGKIALVTGGGSGIGRASALAFAREGATTVVADIDAPGGNETLHMIREAGGDSLFVKTDVSQEADVKAMVVETVDTFGRIDCALNNAGILGAKSNSPDSLSKETWDRVLSVNLTGVWLCLRYEIEQMLQQNKGVIVNMASAAGVVGTTNAAYTASQHGVVGLTKSAALSFARKGIRVNAVCPSYIQTPMVASVTGGNSQIHEQLNAAQPIGRMGTPEEVAETVVWLCSDAASFITGHAMAVDGGYTAR